MKNNICIAILILLSFTVHSQTLHYFEFRQPLENTFNSFIVATADPSVIDEVVNDIALPVNERRFISGNITKGHGGFNKDGTNWYTWHYIPNEWELTLANVEYCDGISSAIGNHPSVIAGDTIYFCPWNSYPHQEIEEPELSLKNLHPDLPLIVYPNPVSDKLFFKGTRSNKLSIAIYDVAGQNLIRKTLTSEPHEIEVSNLAEGVYFVSIKNGNKKTLKKIVIKH